MSLLTRQLEAVPPNANSLNVSPKKIGLVSYLRRLLALKAAYLGTLLLTLLDPTLSYAQPTAGAGIAEILSAFRTNPKLRTWVEAKEIEVISGGPDGSLFLTAGAPDLPGDTKLSGRVESYYGIYLSTSGDILEGYATRQLINGKWRWVQARIEVDGIKYRVVLQDGNYMNLPAGTVRVSNAKGADKPVSLPRESLPQRVAELIDDILKGIKKEGIKQVKELPTMTVNTEAPAGTTPSGACAAAKAGIGTTIVGAGVNVASGAVVNSAVTAGLSGLGFNPIDISIATSLAGPLTGEVTGLTGAMVAQNVPGLAGRVLQAGFGSSSTYFAGGGLTYASALAIPLTGWSTTAQIGLTTSEQWNAAAAASLNDGNLGAVRYYSDLTERATSYAGLGVLGVAFDDWAAAVNAPGPIPDYIPFAKDINVRVNLAREGWYWACQIFDRR